jgi:general L-amino acid transport system substrate-binding protein
VRKGDDKWFDIVQWIAYAQMTAEEDGVNSKNVDTFTTTTNPDIRRLLGMDGDLGKQLGLDPKWAYNVIKLVGNTAEVWDANITPLGVPRGINALWNKGGLSYAPPMR